MKVNIGQKSEAETSDIDYVYQNYRPGRTSGSYNSYFNKKRQDYRWLFQILVSGAILLIIAGLFRFDIPFTGPVKSTVRYLMNTDANVQPVFMKIVQLASQQGNLEWPLVDDIPQPAATVSTPVSSDVTLNLPVSGKVSRLYGWTVLPEDKIQVFHQGLDIDVPVGTEVKAAAKGRVMKTGEDSMIGKYILIQNSSGDIVRYASLSKIFVQNDQPVKAGEVIAKTGDFEDQNPHLHFEVIVNGKPVDPLSKLGLDLSGRSGTADIIRQ